MDPLKPCPGMDTDILHEASLTLYSMPFCPFAQRARLIMAAKKISYELVNIDLNQKPDWFFALNPNGEVPVLVHNKNVIYESTVCCEYIEETFRAHVLFPDDPGERARHRMLIITWSKKGIPAFYALLQSKDDVTKQRHFEVQIGVVESFLASSQNIFLNQRAPGMVDYLVWPWFERLPVLLELTGFDLPVDKFPCVRQWIQAMGVRPEVIECSTSKEDLIKFYDKYRVGKPDFTMTASKENAKEIVENLDHLRDPKTRFLQTNNLKINT